MQEDWPEFATYARTNGSHFSPMLSLSDADSQSPDPADQPRRSSEIMSPSESFRAPSPGMRERRDTESHGPEARNSAISATSELGIGHPPRDRPSQAPSQSSARIGTGWKRGSRIPTVIQRDRAIEKAALVESAERIYLRYLLPGAEREIYLP